MRAVDDMVDTIHADVGRIPPTVRKVAGYLTGTQDIAWTTQDWDRFKHAAKVRISQRPGLAVLSCDVFDIEEGAWEIPQAINAAQIRRRHGKRSTFYCPRSKFTDAAMAVDEAGLHAWVDFWVADPNITRDEAIAHLGGLVKAWQWAFPSTNPGTFIPGTRVTLQEANADLSVTLPGWHPIPQTHRVPRPHLPAHAPIHPKVKGAGVGATIAGAIIALLHATGVHHITNAEASAAGVVGSLIAGYLAPRGR